MLTLKAYAKINLTLDVLGKREDGYHEVAMIMQAIGLADTLSFAETDGDVSVISNIPELESGPGNLVYRAAVLLKTECAVKQGVRIELDKQIPLAAGLAGGSADAAAALKGLNDLWNLRLTMPELSEFGARLGSDVPFCLHGGTMLATGRGEKLAPLPAIAPCWAVLAKPDRAVSTAWVYQHYRTEKVLARPDLPGMRAALAHGDLAAVSGRLCNVLESVTIPECPEIAVIKAQMLENGAMASLMSGSGPTVFGLTAQQSDAERIARRLADSNTAIRVWTAKIG